MTSILKSTKLLYNLVGFTRRMSGLTGKNKEFLFLEYQRINFNKSRARYVTALTEKQEDPLSSVENFQAEIYQLKTNLRMKRRVFKEDILNVFAKLKQNGEMKSDEVSLLLKSCTPVSFMCSENERIQLAKDIWNFAVKLGTALDINHYNALLLVFVVNNHDFSLEFFLNEMKKAGVTPNLTTYRLLLKSACERGDIEKARKILKEMKDLNFPLNLLDFNALILGYSKTGDFKNANKILEIMKEKSIKPESESYVSLLCGYIENGNFQEFEELFQELNGKLHLNLSDLNLLKIFYALALNNGQSHIDMVLKKIRKNYNYENLVSDFIQRLLHKKLDSMALKLLETIDLKGKIFNQIPFVSRHILDHFICYRKPSEILSMCEKLEKTGYARVAIGYALKRVLLLKNEMFSMKFLKEMKAQSLPMRCHYFWPILIKASKKGNKSLMSIFQDIPKFTINNRSTIQEIILPHYMFSEEWDADIEKLWERGIPRKLSALHLMTDFLIKNKLDEVEKIVTNYPVDTLNDIHIFNILFQKIEAEPEKIDQAVNVLYNFYHDVYLEENATPAEDSEKHNEKTSENYSSKVVSSLLKNVKDEKIIRRVLEAMLEKRISINSATCSKIIASLKNQNMEDLAKKLSDPNLNIELNENLLALKLQLSKMNVKDLNPATSLRQCLSRMLMLAQKKRTTKALELGEDFLKNNTEVTGKESVEMKYLYKGILREVSCSQDSKLFEKVVSLGTRLGVLENDSAADVGAVVLGFLRCDNIDNAFEEFKKFILLTGKDPACVELLMKCISNERTEMVDQIIHLLTTVRDKDYALTRLIIALINVGKIQEAKEVFDNKEFILLKVMLFKKLFILYKYVDSEVLEHYLEFLKHLKDSNLDLTPLYKMLTKKYAEENKIDKIHQLFSEIKKKNINDEGFRVQFSEFQKKFSNQEDFDVSQWAKSITLDFNSKPQETEINFIDRILETCTSESRDESINYIPQRNEGMLLATTFASLGNVDRVFSLVQNNASELDVQKIAKTFLKFDKVNEFFMFLDCLASKGDFRNVIKCFNINSLFPVLRKNDEYLQKYKSLLVQCAEEPNFSEALIKYLAVCIQLPEKLMNAEEILEKFPDHFKNTSFLEIKKKFIKQGLASDFFENILSSKTLKSHFSDHLHEFYSQIIAIKCEQQKLDSALNYLEQAIGDKVENLLKNDVIITLQERLRKEGKDFPYPKLCATSD